MDTKVMEQWLLEEETNIVPLVTSYTAPAGIGVLIDDEGTVEHAQVAAMTGNDDGGLSESTRAIMAEMLRSSTNSGSSTKNDYFTRWVEQSALCVPSAEAGEDALSRSRATRPPVQQGEGGVRAHTARRKRPVKQSSPSTVRSSVDEEDKDETAPTSRSDTHDISPRAPCRGGRHRKREHDATVTGTTNATRAEHVSRKTKHNKNRSGTNDGGDGMSMTASARGIANEQKESMSLFRRSQKRLRSEAPNLSLKDILSQCWTSADPPSDIDRSRVAMDSSVNVHNKKNDSSNPCDYADGAAENATPSLKLSIDATWVNMDKGSAVANSVCSPSVHSPRSNSSAWSPKLVDDLTQTFLANVKDQKRSRVARLLPRDLTQPHSQISNSGRLYSGSNNSASNMGRGHGSAESSSLSANEEKHDRTDEKAEVEAQNVEEEELVICDDEDAGWSLLGGHRTAGGAPAGRGHLLCERQRQQLSQGDWSAIEINLTTPATVRANENSAWGPSDATNDHRDELFRKTSSVSQQDATLRAHHAEENSVSRRRHARSESRALAAPPIVTGLPAAWQEGAFMQTSLDDSNSNSNSLLHSSHLSGNRRSQSNSESYRSAGLGKFGESYSGTHDEPMCEMTRVLTRKHEMWRLRQQQLRACRVAGMASNMADSIQESVHDSSSNHNPADTPEMPTSAVRTRTATGGTEVSETATAPAAHTTPPHTFGSPFAAASTARSSILGGHPGAGQDLSPMSETKLTSETISLIRRANDFNYTSQQKIVVFDVVQRSKITTEPPHTS